MANRLLFFHYEPQDTDPSTHFTIAVKHPKETKEKFTFSDALFSFCKTCPLTSIPYAILCVCSQKHELESSFVLNDDKGREVGYDKVVAKHRGDDFVVSPKGEKFREVKKNIELKLAEARKTRTTVKKTVVKKVQQLKPEDDLVAMQLCESAFAAFKKDDFVSARDFATKSIERNSKFWQSYSLLAQIEKECGRHEKAAQFWNKVIDVKKDDIEAYISLGQELFFAQKYEDSVKVFQTCLTIAKSSGNIAKMDEITGYLGMVFMKMDQQENAHGIISQVLSRDQTNVFCLIVYAQSLMYMVNKGKAPNIEQFLTEALQVRLSNFTKNTNNPIIVDEFVESIKCPGSVKRLMGLLNCGSLPLFPPSSLQQQYQSFVSKKFPTPNPSLSQAFSVISKITKDHGVIEEAADFQRCAFCMNISSASEALAMIHNYETNNDYCSALIAARMFFAANDKAVNTVRFSMIDKELSLIKPETWKTNKPFSGDLFKLFPPQLKDDIALISIDESKKPQDFKDEEKYSIAILFTLVKICYTLGLLNVARDIAALSQTLQAQNFHKTFIRNENAYFTYVSMLLNEVKLENTLTLTPKSKIIYVVGDSHALSCAWQSVPFRGDSYTLVPYPATGIKIWHTRKGCEFYPRKHLDLIFKSIPKESPVIFILGEIDCREGFEKAVKKTKFGSIAEVTQSTIDIYMNMIKRARRDKKFEIFVHPIPPVLDVTRGLVMPANAMIKTALETYSKNDKLVHYLDFVDQLIMPVKLSEEEQAKNPLHNSGFELKQEFRFDGTHLAPKYVPLLLAPQLAKF